jgi:hypothetical protein
MKALFSFCVAVVLLTAGLASAQIPIGAVGNFLAIGNYNNSQASSDLGAVVQLEAGGTILIDEGDPVKYFFNQSDNNLEGVTDWMMPRYDDSGWEDGFNAVGYNANQITEVPDTGDQGAIYTRFRRFGLPNAASITSMTIRIDYDDGVIVWLNGVEVLRSQMTTDAAVPGWIWGTAENHESSNKLGPDPSRWSGAVSNLLGVGEDNPEESIIDYTFDVAFDPTAVEPADKLSTSWGSIKAHR